MALYFKYFSFKNSAFLLFCFYFLIFSMPTEIPKQLLTLAYRISFLANRLSLQNPIQEEDMGKFYNCRPDLFPKETIKKVPVFYVAYLLHRNCPHLHFLQLFTSESGMHLEQRY